MFNLYIKTYMFSLLVFSNAVISYCFLYPHGYHISYFNLLKYKYIYSMFYKCPSNSPKLQINKYESKIMAKWKKFHRFVIYYG